MTIVEANDQSFEKEIADGLVLIDFWAPWCGPCKMIAPVLQEISDEMGEDLRVVKVDVDKNQASAAKYGIMSIPTMIIMKDGELKEKIIGFTPKEKLKPALRNYL